MRLGLSYKESLHQHFRDNNILTVPAIYIKECIIFARKNPNKIVKLGDSHDCNTRPRHKDKICVPAHRTARFEQKPSYVAGKFYNELPQKIKSIIAETGFKKELKQYLIQKDIYGISDFLSWFLFPFPFLFLSSIYIYFIWNIIETQFRTTYI